MGYHDYVYCAHPPLKSRNDPDYDPFDVCLEQQAQLLKGLIGCGVTATPAGHTGIREAYTKICNGGAGGETIKFMVTNARDRAVKHADQRTVGTVTKAWVDKDGRIMARMYLPRLDSHQRARIKDGGLLGQCSITDHREGDVIHPLEVSLCTLGARNGTRLVMASSKTKGEQELIDFIKANKTTLPKEVLEGMAAKVKGMIKERQEKEKSMEAERDKYKQETEAEKEAFRTSLQERTDRELLEFIRVINGGEEPAEEVTVMQQKCREAEFTPQQNEFVSQLLTTASKFGHRAHIAMSRGAARTTDLDIFSDDDDEVMVEEARGKKRRRLTEASRNAQKKNTEEAKKLDEQEDDDMFAGV